MKIWSYVVYIILFEALVLGGAGYAVFILGQSGWWFALATVLGGCCFKPERWSALWDDGVAEKYRKRAVAE